MKDIIFHGDVIDRLRRFSADARRQAGFQLFKAQRGLTPDDWTPIPEVGLGVHEIRLRTDDEVLRVMYVARFADAVHVLHAFEQDAGNTSRKEVVLAGARFNSLHREESNVRSLR